jgi:outer membrane protein insertion porin family
LHFIDKTLFNYKKNINYIFVLSIVIFLPYYAISQKKVIGKKEIIGCTLLDKEFVIQQLSHIDTLQNSVNDTIQDEIRKIYLMNGIYSTEVDSISFLNQDAEKCDINIHITEGNYIFLEKVSFTGNVHFKAERLNRCFSNELGVPFNQLEFEKSISKIIRLYETEGFPFIKIRITDFRIQKEKSKIEVSLAVEEDSIVKINDIRAYGNINTKNEVISRECGIHLGEIYNRAKIEKIRNKLLRLDIFQNVEEPFLTMLEHKAIINIRVSEKQSNSFDGIIGYQPGSGSNEKGYLSGLVNIAFRNLFGTGRKLKINWNRETKNNQQTEIAYTEPWVAGLPLNINLRYYQRDQDSTFVRRNLNFNGYFSISDYFDVSLSGNYETIIPGSENSLNSILFKSNLFLMGLELLSDTRNNGDFSENGLFYSNKIELGNKKYSSDNSTKFVKKYYFKFEDYQSLSGNQVFYISLTGRIIDAGSVDFSDLFSIGGFNSVRGYRENMLFGTQTIWSNIEYRFKTGRNSFIYPFFDSGYFYRPITTDGFSNVKDYLYGYGVGITMETQFGIVKVNYALGKGDSFSNGKIHFGYVNQF